MSLNLSFFVVVAIVEAKVVRAVVWGKCQVLGEVDKQHFRQVEVAPVSNRDYPLS